MTARDGFRFALSNLLQQKVRTLLTTMGVVIGVGAVVLMVSGGIGLQRQVLKQFESVEAMSSIMVLPIKVDLTNWSFEPKQLPTPKSLNDRVIADLRRLEGVTAVYPNVHFHLPLSAGKRKIRVDVAGLPLEGVTTGLREAVVAGGLWAQEGAHVLLTTQAAKALDLGAPEAAIGKEVRFVLRSEREDDETGAPGTPADPGEKNGSAEPSAPPAVTPKPPEDCPEVFTVVGVYDPEKYKGFGGGQVFLPLAVSLKVRRTAGQDRGGFRGLKKGEYGELVVHVASPELVKGVSEEIRSRGMGTITADDLISQLNILFLVIEGFLGCLGGVGLLVAFVGIVNTMLMSILERTREIGIMKAVGARNRDVRRIFLIEATTIGLVGGALGIFGGWFVGVGLNLAVRLWLGTKGGPKDVSVFQVSWLLGAAAMLFSVLVSALAGVYPAWRAARLDPVKALRRD
ncbi:MAG: ABC transporter permease [Planctomycetes bacterium]|nr:ABC transporter permease [Planctomycetota bacterium]